MRAPSVDPRYAQPAVAPRPVARPAPVQPAYEDPEPLDLSLLGEPVDDAEPLDLSAIGEPLDPEPLDGDALEPVELGLEHLSPADPQELDADALLALDPDALLADALAAAEASDPFEPDTAARAEALDTSQYGGVVDDAPVDDTPLVEGFENTRFDEIDRRARKKQREAEAAAAESAKGEFSYSTCPSCEAPQPQPSPSYCEACGTRLRKPGKKGDAAALGAIKRCGECGYKNRLDAGNCTNCGSRLPSND